MTETERARSDRPQRWHRDFSSPEAYARSVAGIASGCDSASGSRYPRASGHWRCWSICTERRLKPRARGQRPPCDGASWRACSARVCCCGPKAGRWPWSWCCRTPSRPRAAVGLQSGLPLEAQIARRLVENGCLVLVPTLVDRQDTFSGNRPLNRWTNQPTGSGFIASVRDGTPHHRLRSPKGAGRGRLAPGRRPTVERKKPGAREPWLPTCIWGWWAMARAG